MNGRSSTGPEAFAGVEQREHGIILSSRVRLARNLQDLAFPPQAAAGVLDEVCLRVEAVLCKGAPLFEKLGKASPRRLQELFEEHLISRDLLKHRPGAAIRMNAEGRHSVMVNEEDHLRIQVLLPGLALRRAWEEADRLDDELEQRLDYAFSPSLGYLTSCPSNVGTGMRASVLMHLPGLVMMREMEPIMNGLGKIGLTVRGTFGEGSEAKGHMFQISNQITMGQPEERIVEDLEEIAKEIVGHEENARLRLREEREAVLQDVVARAAAILSSAYLISAEEALERLADLRLGVAMGLMAHPTLSVIDRLMVGIQPAHLLEQSGKELSAKERDELRASWLRDVMQQKAVEQKRRKTR